MSKEPIANLVKADLSNPKRCFLFGSTPLGGADACRPEMQEDGSIFMRSLNLSHTVYRITPDEYRELRNYPKLKVGMWSFADENDQDAERIASAHRYPESAGRRIGELERQIDRITEERDRIERNRDMYLGQVERQSATISAMREALDEAEDYFDNRADADCDEAGYHPNKEMLLLQVVREALRKAGKP